MINFCYVVHTLIAYYVFFNIQLNSTISVYNIYKEKQ
jgi:hypothetical protein